MKSRLIHSIGMRLVFSLGLLMGYGLAQAAPACNPDYSNGVSGVTPTVTLSANCTPDVAASISAKSGYEWGWDISSASSPANLMGDTTSNPVIPSPVDSRTYFVRATESGPIQGGWGKVTVHTETVPECKLAIAGGGTSTSISAGQTVTLVPDCPGTYSPLGWYAAAHGVSPGSPITPPPGGVVSPSTSTDYYVVGGNDIGDTASNAVSVTISVSKISQTISFGSAPSVVVGGTGTVSATATSGLSVSFTSQTPSVCAISGSTVTGGSTGTCTIAANQVGNGSYNAAPQATQSFTIGSAGLLSQTISFGSAPGVVVGGTGTVSATATSGLPVSFTSQTPSVCTVSGSTVTGASIGTCTIAANQAGNGSYNAAPQVTQSFSVTSAVVGDNSTCTALGLTNTDQSLWAAGVLKNFNIPANNAISFAFTGGNLNSMSTAAFAGGSKVYSVSTKKCDFANTTLINSHCTVGIGAIGTWSIPSSCTTPGQTYYLSIRNGAIVNAGGQTGIVPVVPSTDSCVPTGGVPCGVNFSYH